MKKPSVVTPRRAGAVIYGIFSAFAGYLVLWSTSSGEVPWRHLRETLPLAALVGGLIGAVVASRWPPSIAHSVLVGLAAALAGFVLFCAVYIFGEALIEAIRGGDVANAVAGAIDRVSLRGAAAVGFLSAGFALAGVAHWSLGSMCQRGLR